VKKGKGAKNGSAAGGGTTGKKFTAGRGECFRSNVDASSADTPPGKKNKKDDDEEKAVSEGERSPSKKVKTEDIGEGGGFFEEAMGGFEA